MPLSGPPPKSPETRARRNADVVQMRTVVAARSGQPELPAGFDWPDRTREWWAMWGESPLAGDFTANDWSELLDTALLHARFWGGEVRLAPELRQRVANFGATPADRAKLRITFAQADDAETKTPRRSASARERRGPLTA